MRVSRWFVFAPVAVLAFFSSNAQAEPYPISVTVFDNSTAWNQYNASPPLPPTTRIAGTFTDTDVWHNFDAQPVFGLREDFVVKYEGFITAPCTCQVFFMSPADDGTKMYLSGLNIINDWYDKGGGGSVSQPVQFQDGVSQPFTLWFYENGGGAWLQLWWQIDGAWEVVPATAFAIPVPTTTSTEIPTTTVQETTTTSMPPTTTEATTTTELTQTTVEPTLPSLPTTTVQIPVQTSVATTTTVAATTTLLQTTTTSISLPIITSTTEPNVAVLTAAEAEQYFEELDISSLSAEDIAALVQEVQQAPIEVRNAFEKAVNVFGGELDDYVPVGSNISVGARRVIVVSTAFMIAMPPPPSRRKF